ncbi:MAG TPA: multidrug effflux MFS transporter [Megamonas hypermegale]|uniref:Bcr/CflA family efflux transporter n=1 Tax=Megamonas hypermegale TaxID=158847 RepID=A0A921HQ15_9FIRM|nr:multidrug effflux MFS transporter [Megamonas hypermegale]MDM8142460.1 multidrug effflux MFS transporter [Megamonas hypermegale]HJF84851.1 multidrug effflux MFS transporter [Megamonas hypermegale]
MDKVINQPTITTNNNTFLITLLALICSIGPLATDMYLPAFPEITAYFTTTPSMVQLTITTWLIGLAVGQIIAGPLSDIYGRQKPLIFSLVFFTISVIACIFSPSIHLFIFARLIGGFAASSALVIGRAIASDVYSGTMLTKFLSTVMIIQGIAPIIAPVLGGQLLLFFPWTSVFVILAFASLIIIVLSACKYKESLPKEKRIRGNLSQVLKIFFSLCARPYFASLCAIQFFIFCSLFAYISGMPFILQGIYGFSPQQFSFVFAFVGVGMMCFGKLTNILTGRVADGKLLFLGLCQGVFFGVLFLIGVLLNLNIYILIVFLLLSETSLAITAATSFSLAMQTQKKVAGSASALLGFFSSISGSLVAPIVGIGGGTTAVPTALVIALAEIIALCIFLVVTKKYIKKTAEN